MSNPEQQPPKRGALTVRVAPEVAGQRLDNFLINQLKGAPRSYVYRIVRSGEVRVNKGRAKPSQRLLSGDEVRIPPTRVGEPGSNTPGSRALAGIEQAILAEDDDFLVINKPSGLAVHGGSGISFGVIELVRAARPQLKQLELVHRLDRDTSGILVLSKKRSRLRELHEQIREHRVEKRYLALVHGDWQHPDTLVSAPLQVNERRGGERVVRVAAEGKEASSLFYVRERYNRATLVEVQLITGRTHQIRVHAAHCGHPLAGDEKYGNEEFNRWCRQTGLKRLFLHASQIAFTLPGRTQPYLFEAPMPAELTQFIETMDLL